MDSNLRNHPSNPAAQPSNLPASAINRTGKMKAAILARKGTKK